MATDQSLHIPQAGEETDDFRDSPLTVNIDKQKMEDYLREFTRFSAAAEERWVKASMPLADAKALIRAKSTLRFLLTGYIDVEADMAELMAAYAGKDGLRMKQAVDVATRQQRELPRVGPEGILGRVAGVPSNHPPQAG